MALAWTLTALVAWAGQAPSAAAQSGEPVDPYAAPAAPAPPPEKQPGQESSSAPDPDADAAELGAPDDDLDDRVAQALYRRGVLLYRRGDAAAAKQLFIESLERSPRGRSSAEAARMLRQSNRRLGLKDLDDGRPGTPSHDAVLDPYGAAGGGPPPATDGGPLDPYGAPPPSAPPAPVATLEPAASVDRAAPARGSALGRRLVIGWSGAVGLVAGLAVAGPENDAGETSDGAALAGLLGAAGGVGLSWWLTDRYPVSAGQSAAIATGATWGAASAGLLGDAATGTDSDPNDVWKYVAVGGLVGLGGGMLYGRAVDPTVEDMALIDSLSVLGAGAGLCIAAGMEPPESEAFSLNALFGGAAGLAAGLLMAPRVELSTRRTLLLDLGAMAGAAAVWGLVYPLMKDDTTRDDEQIAGWLSTATLAGGFGATWYLTRNMEAGPRSSLARRSSAPPALARRDADGGWQLGLPLVRPFQSRALAPRAGTALGVDVLAGRF